MPKSVLIILAAVVVLIAVVVILGMRYLRSDDEEFDEAAAAGPGHDRHVPPARRRRGHDDFDVQRDLPRPAARSAAGRDSREAGPRRESRGGRGGHLDDDRTELVPVGGRAAPSQQGGSRVAGGSDTPAGRSRTAARDFDRDGRDRDVAARRDARGRGQAARPAVRDGHDRRDSDIRDPREGRATRTAPAVRELAVADLDEPDRRDAARAAKDRGGREQQDEVLPAVKPRQGKGKGKRDADVEWPTSEWDELSDVDYWTELAADKPFTAGAPAASRARRPARASAQQNGAPSRSSRRSETEVTRRLDQPLLPPAGRGTDRPAADRGSDWARSGRDADRRGRGDDLTPTGPRRGSSVPGERMDAERLEPPRSRHAASLDDDPLTSPSFPRVEANDSRSYRRNRSGSHERPAVGSEYAAAPTGSDQPTAAYARPAANGYRNAAASHDLPVPDSYLMPASNGAGRHSNGQHNSGQHNNSQHGAGLYNGGYREPAPYGTDSAGYDTGASYDAGSAHYDQAPRYGAGPAGYDFGTAGYGSDPLGLGGYGSEAHSGAYDSLPSGYAGQHQAGAGYPPAGLAEPAYPYQTGGPESYSPPVAPTAPYLYQVPSGQAGAQANRGGYAGADPYAVDPYGYGNTSY